MSQDSKNDETTGSEEKETVQKDKVLRKVKNATDLQRLKLEKLLRKHAENKDVFIPDKPKERKLREPLEFIRNIWGSSAGVGSGDFDVYRGIRRRENARQKFILHKAEQEDLDEAYKEKVKLNYLQAEEKTAKKRDKRQRRKQRQKDKKMKTEKLESTCVADDGSSSDSPEDNDTQPKDPPANRDDRVGGERSGTDTSPIT